MLKDFQKCFIKFDKSNNGLMPIFEIGNLLRSGEFFARSSLKKFIYSYYNLVGLNPSEKEIAEIIEWLESNSNLFCFDKKIKIFIHNNAL